LLVTGSSWPLLRMERVGVDVTIGIRAALDRDLEAINAIYNHYVRTTAHTFELEPLSLDGQRRWLQDHPPRGRYRVLVGTVDREVVGYVSSSPYRPRGAYQTSVETSVYVAPSWQGRGVGSRLYAALFGALAGEDVHRAYAGITMPNPASVALHERFGFARAGYFTEQGRKFGRYWDVAWFEKRLD
jgi:phosphinothricin acetyltransferase